MKQSVGMILLVLMLSANAGAATYLFVGSNFPILSEETANGEIQGIAVDVARRIGKRLGHIITIRLYPWERAKNLVRTGKADVLMVPYKTPAREKWLEYSATYFFVDKSFRPSNGNSTGCWSRCRPAGKSPGC